MAVNEFPEDYEVCAECGFDHEYENEEAQKWHVKNDPNYCEMCGSSHSEPLICQLPIIGKE